MLIALGLTKVIFQAADYGLAHALPGYAALAFAAGIALFLLGRQLAWRRSGLTPDPRSWVALAATVALAAAGFVLPAVLTAVAGFLVLHIAAPGARLTTSASA